MQTKLDKAFKIIVDISNRKVTIPQAISWYVTDENIAHLNCQVIDEVEDSIIDIQSYKLSMRVLTPGKILKEVNYTLSDATNNIFTITLPDELITEKGRHQCELSIEYLGDKLTSEPFHYNIIQSIANQLDSTISKDSHYPLVLELEDKLKEWNNILDEQVSKVIILDNDCRKAEKTRQANEQKRIVAENQRQEGYIEFKNEVSEELAHNVRYIKLSTLSLGNDSFENLNIILSKLTSNNTIFVVDGDYKIATTEIKDLNYDFNLISFNNGSLIFDNTSNETFFNIKSNVNIENVNFINNTNKVKIIFTTLELNNSTIEKFKVVNCKFDGTFRLAQLTTCTEVKTIELLNNDIRNTSTSFFQTSDFKINSVCIKGNYVKNWLYRFISMTNFENIENMVVSDNTATNTDDWMLSEQVDPSTYYVFALVKAKKIHYFNNHVENIKSKYNVALYDCYAYAYYYVYENNVFKNNICFDFSANNVLMKCKNEGGHKTFKNNLFLIEDKFLEKFNIDKSKFKIKLYDIWGGFEDEVHTQPVDYYIEGNKIIVPNLQLEEGFRLVSNFIFTNNHIKCSNIYNNLINSKSEGAFIKINNNTFENEKGDTFHLIDGKSNIKYSNVEIIGNNINSLKYGIASALVNNCIINNNVINFNCDGATRLTTYLTTDYMVCKGNVLYGATQPTEYDYLGVTNNLLSNNLGSLKNSSIYLHKLDTTNTKTIKVKVIGVNVDSIFTVKVKSDGATFIDSNGNERTFALLSTTGNGTMIKNNGQGSATLTFNNTATYSRLSLTTNTTEYIEVRIFIN